jgi:hypothetical protein
MAATVNTFRTLPVSSSNTKNVAHCSLFNDKYINKVQRKLQRCTRVIRKLHMKLVLDGVATLPTVKVHPPRAAK